MFLPVDEEISDTKHPIAAGIKWNEALNDKLPFTEGHQPLHFYSE